MDNTIFDSSSTTNHFPSFPSVDFSSISSLVPFELSSTVYISLAIFLVFLFVFRDSLSQWKEQCKIKVRDILYKTVVGHQVNGSTLETTKNGPLKYFVDFIDKAFLAPSEAGTTGTYDYTEEDEEEVEEETESDE